MKLFDDYKVYENMTKFLPEGRYMVGIFTARVFDLKSSYAERNGNYAIPLRQGQIMREISYYKHEDGNRLGIYSQTGNKFTIRLHRFVAIVAANHELTIFTNEQKLQEFIGPDVNYDRLFDYRSTSDVYLALKNELRDAVSDSSECDIDHRAGRKARRHDGLLYASPTSHRMNLCFLWIRRKEKDWCWGLRKMRYINGVQSPKSRESKILETTPTTYPSHLPVCHVRDILPLHECWVLPEDGLYCTCRNAQGKRISSVLCHYCVRCNRKQAGLDPDGDSDEPASPSPVKKKRRKIFRSPLSPSN